MSPIVGQKAVFQYGRHVVHMGKVIQVVNPVTAIFSVHDSHPSFLEIASLGDAARRFPIRIGAIMHTQERIVKGVHVNKMRGCRSGV